MQIDNVLLVGYASMDVMVAADSRSAALRVGGVCTNLARVLGAFGLSTTLYTPDYHPEFSRWLQRELDDHHVDWRRLATFGPPAVFLARLDAAGGLSSAEFLDDGVCEATSVKGIAEGLSELGPGLLMTCTDVPLDELIALRSMAEQRALQFGVISTSDEEATKLKALRGRLNFLSINQRELELFAGATVDSPRDATAVALGLLEENGVALVTMGAEGALLVANVAAQNAWLQRVPKLEFSNTVGAGDVMTGALLASYSRGFGHAESLQFATRSVLAYLSRGALEAYPHRAATVDWQGQLQPVSQIQ